MNLRPKKINAHVDWLTAKIHAVESSRVGTDRPNVNPQSYFEKVASFYLVHKSELLKAEALLRKAGVERAVLAEFDAIAASSLPDFLKDAPPPRGRVMAFLLRLKEWFFPPKHEGDPE